MTIESAQYLHQLNSANPSGADRLKEGDDHIRLLKAVLKQTFPGLQGPLDASVTHTFLNGLKGALIPFGTITLFSGADAPNGWALCDGTVVPKSDGSGNIQTPDLRGRVPVGASGDHALLATFGQTSRTVSTDSQGAHSHTGSTAAAGDHTHAITVEGHALTVSEMPGHTHKSGVVDDNVGNILNGATSADTAGGNITTSAGSGNLTSTTSSTGGGSPHTHNATAANAGSHTHTVSVDAAGSHGHQVVVDVTQPSIALNFIMKI